MHGWTREGVKVVKAAVVVVMAATVVVDMRQR